MPDQATRRRAKLTSEKVTSIRAAYAAGIKTYAALALEFNVATSIVDRIVNYKLWKHVGDGVVRKPLRKYKNQKLLPAQVRSIRKESADGASARALGTKYGVSTTNIMNILNRITWRKTV